MVNLFEPRITEKNLNGTPAYAPVFNLAECDVNRSIECKLPPLLNGIDVTADVLFRLFLPDSFISKIVDSSNSYIANRIPLNRRKKAITSSDILQFMAILFYLGVNPVRAKTDLWSKHPEMPRHELAHENNMSLNRFRYIWRNIYFVPTVGDEELENNTDNESDFRC